MKLLARIKERRSKRARKRYEREKEQRAQQDENAMERVRDVGGTIGGGGL